MASSVRSGGGWHVITASLFAVVRVSWSFCPCCPPVSLFRGPATRRSARKSSHRRGHLFGAELERAADARAYLDSRRQAARLFRNKRVREGSEDRTLGDGRRVRRTQASRCGRQTRIYFAGGYIETYTSHRAWTTRSFSISMGARWLGHSVSGPNGTCMAGCKVTNGAHTGLRQSC